MEPPTPPQFDITFGDRHVYGQDRPVGLSRADRRRGVYVVGQTGTGKSTLLHSLIAQDMHRGECVVVIDPHGPLADDVLASVPVERINDVIVVDPSDTERPVGQNPLYQAEVASLELQEQKMNRLFSALHGVYADSWGAELERVLMAGLMALTGARELRPTLFTLLRLIEEKDYRDQVKEQIKNRAAWRYFNETIATYRAGELAQKASSTTNKLFQVLAATPLAHMYGQYRPSFDIGRCLEEKKIIVLRLPMEGLAEQHASLCAALFVTELYHALATRVHSNVNTPLPDTYLYIDEFHKIRTRSFDKLFSEARKVHLNLTVAHQYLDQLAPSTTKAVLGNAGSSVFLRPSPHDVERMTDSIGRELNARNFTNLRNGQAILKRLQNGEPAAPEICNIWRFTTYSDRRRERVRNVSRHRYGRTLVKVRREVDRQSGISQPLAKSPSKQTNRKKGKRPLAGRSAPVHTISRGQGKKKREFFSPADNAVVVEWYD